MGDMADYYMNWDHALDMENNGQVDPDLEENVATARELKIRGKSRTAQKYQLEHKIQRNKFYVGADSALERNWGHPTLAKAVAHAEEVMDEQDRDAVFIVQIIRVVRRKRSPVEVTKI